MNIQVFILGTYLILHRTAVIGLIVYTLPYVFVVIMITRDRNEQTEAQGFKCSLECFGNRISTRAGVFKLAFVVILTLTNILEQVLKGILIFCFSFDITNAE